MSEKTTHFSSHFENKNFYITENDIGDLDLFFMLKTQPDGFQNNFKTHKVKIVREPIFYFSVSNSTPTTPIFSLGSKGVVGYSKGSPVYAGRIITNAFHNMPLINLLVESGIDSGEPTDLPPLDFYIVNKRRKSLIADETNIFQDCMVENLKILDWNFEQGIDTPGRFFVFNFIATDFKGIHLKNYLASQLYNTSGKYSLTPNLSDVTYDLKAKTKAEKNTGVAVAIDANKISDDLSKAIKNLTGKMYGDDETSDLTKSFVSLEGNFKKGIVSVSDTTISNPLKDEFAALKALLDERQKNDIILSKIEFNDKDGAFSYKSLNDSEKGKVRVLFSDAPNDPKMLGSVNSIIAPGTSFKMYCVKDGKNEKLSNYRTIERQLSQVMAYKPGVFINLSKALNDKVIVNKEVIGFFNENKSSALLIGKINEKGDFAPNEVLNSIVAAGKIKDTYPNGYPKLGFTISISSKNQKIEEQIKEKFTGNDYLFDFQYHPEEISKVYDNSVNVIMPEDAFSHLFKKGSKAFSDDVRRETTNSTVNPVAVAYKYVLNQEKILFNGQSNTDNRKIQPNEVTKVNELKAFVKGIIDKGKTAELVFNFYTDFGVIDGPDAPTAQQAVHQFDRFKVLLAPLIADLKKLYGLKVSTKLPDKSVPAPKKYETIFKKGTFPCLFNGNPEEKDGAVYYPKISTKKGETKDDYYKLKEISGVGTRLLRMVTVTISEV